MPPNETAVLRSSTSSSSPRSAANASAILEKPLVSAGRSRRPLSDSGRRLLPALTSGFAGIAEAFAALREEDEDVLNINAPVSFGGTWLSSRIGRFQVLYPDLAVRIALANEVIDLGQGGVDAVIRGGRGQWQGLRADFLFRQHFTPMCTPAFLEQNGIVRPEDLLRVERFAPNDSLWSGWFARAGLGKPPPRQGVVLDSQLQEANAMFAGSGAAMMSPLYWHAELASGRLVQPFDILYLPGTAHWLVHPAGRVGVRKIERFREWLRSELAGDRALAPPEVWEMPE